ncbi:regulation of AMPA receptor activity protein [Homalodisca vitripennis]|nr:regulation of AMPA receptor activity protein [Homalodisca vitripennis]KAG8287286.1 regulation of AMPA receptor activity protein [Homalodisca vitripennis]
MIGSSIFQSDKGDRKKKFLDYWPDSGVSTVSAAYYPYPCPWEVSCDVPWDPGLPRDITVSTTADINCDDIGDFSPHPDFVTFDMDPVPPLGTISRTRQDLETLRRTTPV